MKQQCRKPAKRAPRRDRLEIDDDLAELALALDEARLSNNAHGWFTPPWRDGWNAMMLARHEATSPWHKPQHWVENPAVVAAIAKLDLWHKTRELSGNAYFESSDLLAAIDASYRGARAALRCYQVLLARSDGGGAVYNDILRAAFAVQIVTDVAELVREWRMLDAIGVGASAITKQRPFRIAWDRGLYRAAYALGST